MKIISESQEPDIVSFQDDSHQKQRLWYRYSRWLMILALLIADMGSIVLVIAFAIGIRTVILGNVVLTPFFQITTLIAIFPCLYFLQGLYPAIGISPVDEMRRLTIGTSLGFIALILIVFLMHIPHFYSRTVFILSWVLALGFVPLARYLVRKVFIKTGIWGEPIAVIGPENQIKEISKHLNHDPYIGLRPVVSYKLERSTKNFGEGYSEKLIHSLTSICKANHIRCAIITNSDLSSSLKVDLHSIEDIFERIIWINLVDNQESLWVSFMNLGGMAGIEKKHELAKSWARTQKRGFDLFGSIIGLLILSPFLAIVAILIKLDSYGSVFYRQTRVGKDGKNFQMLKYRTMYQDADQELDEYLKDNQELQQEWENYQKLKQDPRITRVGYFLRLYSIDELPQLWNVLKGEMSLVGPRPFMPQQRELHANTYHRYIRIRPGLSGMWQVYGRSELQYDFRIQMDEYYFRNWSIWLDIYIMIRTPWVVIRKIGAY
ncbi:undecaprenyl-phosphate galactose phosphotransferase WbaP [Chloroflexota bacterium]